ncbi:uncharacterized protein LOC132748885 isoform X2 [Ruditapes philippinarum]|uniref:uncharacterized protein LOC132748885 isoform X2 n=1 Tax=Ruditapes philippinarum TaxID=129788 RepID=UPI00295AFE7E|nr:uncharacterized protein LOC132748885 isoform X2 [Ruditapes philippinarum]
MYSEVVLAKENEIKIGITQELSAALKLVQKDHIDSQDHTVYSTDTANNVCSCIEAIFLHGLKFKAVTKIASYVGLGQEATSQSSLNFWNFVSNYTHGEVIAQLKHLGQITTEIGLCRAWVRVALNDGIMESYIDAMISDSKNLEYFYQRTAYLRDREQPSIMKTYLQGLSNFEFKLSYNASVLNEWSYAPLVLAGIINSRDAPPPVIKTTGQSSKASKLRERDEDSDTVVHVIKNKSRSNLESRCPPFNPMEQPKLGPTSESAYFISSSEFTSRDVEEFKKISKNFEKPLSDCSSSSHMSAPDLPHLNVSPATYVQKYGLHEVSYDETDNPEETTDIVKCTTDNTEAYNTGNSYNTLIEGGAKGDANFSEDEDNKKSKSNVQIEESTEEFFSSPVIEIKHERVRRLESITREAKEDAILNSILTEDLPDTVENEQEILDEANSVSNGKQGSSLYNVYGPTELIDDSPIITEGEKLIDTSEKLLNELRLQEQSKVVDDNEGNIGDETHKLIKTSKSTSIDKLKPQLNLNPQKSAEPDLSDAVALKVDQMRTLDNPEYLSRHRFSLAITSDVQKIDNSSPRKSLPNVLEHHNENEKDLTSSIVDHLYDGMPLNEDTENLSRQFYGENKMLDEMENEVNYGSQPPDSTLKRLNEKRESVGNNLMMTGRGWSSSFDSEAGDSVNALSPPLSSMSLPITRKKSESFGSLLQNYTPASSLSARSVDDVLNNFPARKETVYSTQQNSLNEDTDNLEDFEVVCSNCTDSDINDMSQMLQFSVIANEKGLDAQNFQCKGCSRAIGFIFGKPRVCKFDGCYYCYECHENEEYYIPTRIVHNWDFRKHKVAKKNLKFLTDKEEQPLLNIEEINPRLYEHVPEMQEIKSLRLQLMLFRTYLFTCKQSVAEDLRKLVWPRDYLYENSEIYSLADLLQVPTGSLASSLRKVIKFASKHVYGCRLCSQKGFICELCNNPKVIYAFEVDATYRCDQCKTVFHKECKTDNRPCPKCQRRMSRQINSGNSDIILTPDYDLQAN